MQEQVLTVLLLTINCLLGVSCFCDSRVFIEAVGQHYREKIVVGPTAAPVHVDDCKRVCQLDGKCFAYQMLWTRDKRGYCETVHKVKADFSTIETNASFTLFVRCPWPMVFNQETGSCYLYHEDKMFTWDEGWNYCTSLHPEAHLMDIQSEDEKGVAETLTGRSFGVWLGGRHFQSEESDFVWVYTRTTTSPDDLEFSWDRGDCVLMKWKSVFLTKECSSTYNIICEY